ncbi:MAG: serine/threonine protein kinase [Acidobacteria bacterium]|nr:serine/threonine protein kinase [Acidobacteriota bacterium]MCI0621072.1 serine/threonine protein kinase [Acidobacteriota bacterium]MCI0718231.1 serine/threonine protein kinase [Acidobacteriota bacterium]
MLIGKNLGSYRVLAKTQIGESGAVYKALHTAKRQTYALKLLQGTLAPENPLQRQLLEKLRIAQALDHIHIAKTFPVEIAEDLTIVPLEFIYGQNLSEKVAEGASTVDFTLRVALQTADALRTAHEQNAIHGRLTSNNVLLCADGNIKLVDFGLDGLPEEMLFSEPDNGSALAALSVPSRPPLSRFAYQAPEQVQGEPASTRSDLFSLGVILYELLAGEFLFEGDDRQELVRQIQARDLPKINEVRPGISSSWVKILRALLDKKPANRYPSAQALVEDLRKINYGGKLERLSFQTTQPALSRRSFFRRFLGEEEE